MKSLLDFVTHLNPAHSFIISAMLITGLIIVAKRMILLGWLSPNLNRLRTSLMSIGFILSLFFILTAFNWTVPLSVDHVIALKGPDVDFIETVPRTMIRKPKPIIPQVKEVVSIVDKMTEDFLEDDESYEEKNEEVETITSDTVGSSVEERAPVITPPVREEELPVMIPDQMPRFPGCEDEIGSNQDKFNCATQKLLGFIYEHIRYPGLARENGIKGNVSAQFVVEKDGRIGEVNIVRDIGAGCGREVLRVVELMDHKDLRWIPGRQHGKPVRVRFTLPVKFELE